MSEPVEQGDHCAEGRYCPDRATGVGACSCNSLYWTFLTRDHEAFAANPRMALALKNWRRKAADERRALLATGAILW